MRQRLEHFVPFKQLKYKSVLDVGCGRNKLYEFSLGVDSKKYPSVDIVLDFWDVAQLNKKFDVVLLLQVLEHLDGPDKAVELLANVTDGFLVVEVPNVDSWLWRVVWRLWRGLGMARESVHRDLRVDEVVDCVGRRFEVVDVGFSWFGMIACVVAKKHG